MKAFIYTILLVAFLGLVASTLASCEGCGTTSEPTEIVTDSTATTATPVIIPDSLQADSTKQNPGKNQ